MERINEGSIMFNISYDTDQAASAAKVPAFEPGWYPAKILGYEPGIARGGAKKVVIKVVLKNADGLKRNAKAHACYEHPEDWTRSCAMLILSSLAAATGAGSDGQVDLDAAVGKIVEARATRKVESINGVDTPINYVAEFRPLQGR